MLAELTNFGNVFEINSALRLRIVTVLEANKEICNVSIKVIYNYYTDNIIIYFFLFEVKFVIIIYFRGINCYFHVTTSKIMS